MLKKILYGLLLSSLIPSLAAADLQMPEVSNSGIETKVREIFADVPEMVSVAKCESGYRQFTNSGQPLRGGGGNYIGIFQISETGHAETAKNLGYDIYTVDGNIGYARYLYNRRGTQPWLGCLSAAPTTPTPTQTAPVATPIANGTLTANLQIGMRGDQVLILQKILNSLGYTISPSGAGSPGNETNLFGGLTKAAVQKFQCEKAIACDGNESTTGYGRVGPKTRAVIQQVLPK